MAFEGNTPPKGSDQWKKNESIIAKNPALRAARDKAEGFTKSGGEIRTNPASEQYKANYDLIDWSKK